MSRTMAGTALGRLLSTGLLDAQQVQVWWEPPTIPVGPVAPEPTVARDLVPSLGIGPFKLRYSDPCGDQCSWYEP
jgi:hypothetical protein